MKYQEFKAQVAQFPIITANHLQRLGLGGQTLKNQLTTWRKRRLIFHLRRGVYVLNPQDRRVHPSRIFLANSLYSPSYVSLEWAFAYYGLIPEKVADVTSVAAKKTTVFSNEFGLFRYQHLKSSLFFGYQKKEDENGYPVLIAEPEKALLDFFYLESARFNKKNLQDIFDESYRFQNVSGLRLQILRKYAARFEQKKLEEIVKAFEVFVKRERR